MRKTTALLTVLGLSLVSLLVATSMAPAQSNTLADFDGNYVLAAAGGAVGGGAGVPH